MIYNKEKREIDLSKKILNELDKFILSFIKILEKYVDYVIISGYVSILLGRSRATEDIDIFIKKISKEQFSEFYNEVLEKGFWCINAEKEEEVYLFLKEGLAVRFSEKDKAIPNFEVKFPKDALDEGTFNDFIKVKLSEGEIKISSLERHIVFKRYFLKSEKDLEDALHIKNLFKEKIDYNKINKLREALKQRKKYER